MIALVLQRERAKTTYGKRPRSENVARFATAAQVHPHYRIRPQLNLFLTPETFSSTCAPLHLPLPLVFSPPAVNKRVSDTPLLPTSFEVEKRRFSHGEKMKRFVLICKARARLTNPSVHSRLGHGMRVTVPFFHLLHWSRLGLCRRYYRNILPKCLCPRSRSRIRFSVLPSFPALLSQPHRAAPFREYVRGRAEGILAPLWPSVCMPSLIVRGGEPC